MPHDDFEIEPVPGLPEQPPTGEQILWQGKPDWWALTQEALSFWWVAGYFAVLTLWRFVTVVDMMPLPQAIAASLPFVILGGIVCGLLTLFAWIQARLTLYTVTTSRVAMRIGAALTVTLNIPYKQVANASLDLRKSGTGTIAFETMGETRLSYLMCWPHVRPWRMKQTEPALRCIPEAQHVANLISDAAHSRVSQPVIELVAPTAGETVAAE
jgi:hypothetical protein